MREVATVGTQQSATPFSLLISSSIPIVGVTNDVSFIHYLKKKAIFALNKAILSKKQYKVVKMWLSESQKFGVAFTFGGFLSFLFGVLTFFDRALLALGNVLFLIGLLLIIGPHKTYNFFTRPTKRRGSFFFSLGIVMILFKWTFAGFLVESLGIIGLFGDFFAIIVQFLRSLPVVGPLLSHPAVAPYVDRLAGVRVLPV